MQVPNLNAITSKMRPPLQIEEGGIIYQPSGQRRGRRSLNTIHHCAHCDYSTKVLFKLKRHTLLHTGEKPFACFLCSYRTVRKDHLKQHLVTHTGQRPHVCPHCNYAAARKDTLNFHLNTQHKDALNFHLNTQNN